MDDKTKGAFDPAKPAAEKHPAIIAEAQNICDAAAQLVSTQTKSDEDRVKKALTPPAFMDTLQEMSEDPRQEAALSAALLAALAVWANLAETLQVNYIQRVRTGSCSLAPDLH